MSIVASLSSRADSSVGFVDVDSFQLLRLNPDVRFGPAEYIAGHVMHLAKDLRTGKYFRVGEKELFLLQQLNGEHTFEKIRSNYARRFGRSITTGSVQGALSLFAYRGLIIGLKTDTPSSEIEVCTPTDAMSPGPFTGKILHWNPDDWIGSVVPYFRWLLNGPALIAWGLLILCAELIAFSHASSLWKEFLGHPASSWPLRLIAVGLVSCAVMNFHEFGHALACKRYGGAVQEMGYLFRYLSFCAYTRIDDILLFRKRLHRVYVLIIGPFVSLSLIPVALLLWMRTQPNTLLHTTTGDLLILYNFGCFVQLVPFLQFDGYFILAQLLKMPDLRKDSYNYLIRWCLSLFSSRPPMTVAREHAGYLIPIYVGYGSLSLLVSSAALCYMLAQNGRSIVQTIGIIPSLTLLCLLITGAVWRILTVTVPWVKSVIQNKPSKELL